MTNSLAALLLLALAPPALGQDAEAPAPAPAVTPASEPGAPSTKKKGGTPPPLSVVSQTAEAQASITGFMYSAGLTHAVGSGTFTNPSYASFVGANVGVGVSYSFRLAETTLRAAGAAGLGWEYTLPAASTGRRFSWSDIRLGLSAPAVIRESFTGIAVTPSIGATVPISLESRRATTITVLSAGAAFSRTFGRFDFMYRVGGSRGFHAQPLVATSASAASRDPFNRPIALCREGAQWCTDFAGMNTAWGLSNSLGVNFRATDKLSFDMGILVGHSWNYAAAYEVDEYTPKALDSNGNPVAKTGMGRADRLSGSIGVGYALTPNIGTSLSLSTEGPAVTADNKTLRNPFIDFVSPAGNLTSVSFSISAFY